MPSEIQVWFFRRPLFFDRAVCTHLVEHIHKEIFGNFQMPVADLRRINFPIRMITDIFQRTIPHGGVIFHIFTDKA